MSVFQQEELGPECRIEDVSRQQHMRNYHGKFPFCHPRPVVDTVSGSRDWFYADTIIQEVKLLNSERSHCVVRWIAYEDEYNTVEPEENLSDTAVLALYKNKNNYVGAGAKGPPLLRGSTRILNQAFQLVESSERHVCKTMYMLDESLKRQEHDGHYSPAIGFVSRISFHLLLESQFGFINEQFFQLIDNLDALGFSVGKSYLNHLFGSQTSKNLKKFKLTTAKTPSKVYQNIMFVSSLSLIMILKFDLFVISL